MSGSPSARTGGLLWGPPCYRPATPWPPGSALLATALITAAGLAAMAVVTLLAADLGGQGRPPTRPETLPAVYLWGLAAMQGVAVALTLLASRLFGGRARDILALHGAPAGWRTYAGAMLLMASLQVVLAGMEHALLGQDVFTDLRPFVDLITGPDWLLAAAVLSVGAPLSEELLFRGFLLGALAQSRLGFAGAALISTAAWTALHYGYSPAGLAQVFAIGLFLCWLLWRTGSLRVAILCHAAFNGALVLGLRLVDLPS